MRTISKLSVVIVIAIAVMATTAFAQGEHKFDKAGYSKIAKKSIGAVISGKANPDTMIADMEKLVAIGVDGCKEHMNEKATPPEEKKIMKLVVDNADTMKAMSLNKIEAEWHDGGFLKANGVDLSKYDHFAEVTCHLDTVVHAATAIICLNEYKKTNKGELMDQVKAELQEVVEHLKHLE